MKKTLLVLFILFSISCFSQFSKTHYIPPLTCATNLAGDHYLYISTPSSVNVNYKIIANGITIYTGVVKNDAPEIYPIGQGDNTQLFTPKTTIGIIKNKGFVVEAEDLIYVSVRVNAGFNTGPNGSSSNYAHAGGLVSKGNSALGKVFRLGAMMNPLFDTTLLNFASIFSTENGTKVTISNIPVGTVLSNGIIISGDINIILNKNESYVLAFENYNNSVSNSSKMIGALVESDKPVVVNSGSFGGSNSTFLNSQGNPSGRDVGFDQIVPYEKTGKEYIFIKGRGTGINEELESVLLIANKPLTVIYLNGSTAPYITLNNPGDYIAIDGNQFSDGNLYVNASENVFAYQSIAGSNSAANQNLFFVPPLNCSTPSIVDNIPFIESIGSVLYKGSLNIVTETGATVTINNKAITSQPIAIVGKPDYERYTVFDLTGNITVKSTKQVYVSYFGTNNFATYGGYYSGFDTKPEIITDKMTVSNAACIPNVVLKISTLSSYDAFQWYFNDDPISGANSNSYTPTQPGFYQVKGTITGCPSSVPIFSDKIPVSQCPTNLDNDLANDNIDLDNDNDGITNCTESYGNQNIDVSNQNGGNIVISNYSNSFTGKVTTAGTGVPTGTFTGKNDGSFITEIPAGKENTVTYTLTFTKPLSIGIEYVTTGSTSDLLNTNAEYIINTDVNKTITVLNPNNQLLIDTNYDGIYESGITQHSSFEIRFRLNSTTALAPGTGTFKFLTYLANTLSFTHKNLSDNNPNKSALKFFAICVPKDTDLDGVTDDLDTDSDNDKIPDTIEAQVNNSVAISNADTNNNGLDNAFETGLTPVDTDNDGVLDYLDLDSDNDGILDLAETGNDLDADGIRNYRDLDSDKDLCNDVIEAGFSDANKDGILGSSAPPTVDANGLVKSGIGYTTPNPNYITAAPIVITTQPNVTPTCELQNATITLVDNNGNTYQWQLSTNGTTWTNIIDDAIYAGATTNTLSITTVKNAMNGTKFRVQLNQTGNSCGLVSAETTLTVYALPVVKDSAIIQCGSDLSGFSTFNLTVKNNEISNNFAQETFTYYTSLAGANTANSSELITTPLAFRNTTAYNMPVWSRVVNANGCFRVAKLNLQVLATQIPTTFKRAFKECDDFLDIDGVNNANNNKRDEVSAFNFSSVTTDIRAILPPGNYTITYYKNQADALAELNSITTISNYRNIGYPGTQNIWVRVDSDEDNACYGLGPFVTVTVEALPFANAVVIPRKCDDNQDGKFSFDTTALESTLLNGQTNVTVTYLDQNNHPLKDSNGILITSPFPATFTTTSNTIKAIVTNNSALKCFDETQIVFTVDDLPEAFAIPAIFLTECDDEIDPADQNGLFDFNTSTLESAILKGQNGMKVTYTLQNGTVLSTLAPKFKTGTQNVLVTVTNPLNQACSATTTLEFIVNPLPNINLNTNGNDNELVCSNNPTFLVQLNAGIQDSSPVSDYTYVWSKDGTILSSTAATLDINAEGIYTIKVTTLSGCSRIRTIKVTASDVAKIENIAVLDLTAINTVTVYVTGSGKYEYSLNEPNGPFQDSNFFDNIPAGIHEVYINDKNGCGTVSKTISVIGVPKFFTPNGDGYNDYWNVKGINAAFNENSTIYIYNRYGKLLKQIIPSSQGWDGTFTGQLLPSDDYWYSIKLEDGREAKGHFSLKR